MNFRVIALLGLLCVGSAGLAQTPAYFNVQTFKNSGDVDDTASIQRAVDAATTAGGGVVFLPFRPEGYVVSKVDIAGSNIIIDGNGSTVTQLVADGYLFAFKGSLEHVGIRNFTLVGQPNSLIGTGIRIATTTGSDHIVDAKIENVTVRSFAQYGVNVGSVSGLYVNNVRIEDHGSILEGAVGIGFVIFPKDTQHGCKIEGLYSRINPNMPKDEKNKPKNTFTAVKIQVTSDIVAENIHAINGTEETMVVDATNNSQYSNIIIENDGQSGIVANGITCMSNEERFGLSVRDASFSMTNLSFKGPFFNAIAMGRSGTSNCTIKDVDMSQATGGNRLVVSSGTDDGIYMAGYANNCTFVNFTNCDMRFNLYQGTASNCSVKNVRLNTGAFTLTGNNNTVSNVLSDHAGMISVVGNENLISMCSSYYSTGNSFQLNGDRNTLAECVSVSPVGRNVWVQGGTENVLKIFSYQGGLGILDNGAKDSNGSTTKKILVNTIP